MVEEHQHIGFEHKGIGGVLRHNDLEVPSNQRSYAWKEEVRELYQDLAKSLSDDQDYFLGTIVTIPRGERLEVVDGQQRLATISLLLAAIRDHDREVGEALRAQAIQDQFLASVDRRLREAIPKLKLNVDDNELFTGIVKDDPKRKLPVGTKASQARLLAAFKIAQQHVRDIVAQHGQQAGSDELERWTGFIEHRATVALLKVQDDANAYMMFETLNDRGLPTSQADLIKNHLFGRAKSRIGEVQTRWSQMRGALEALDPRDELTIEFLRYSVVLLKGYQRTGELYRSVQETTKSEPTTVAFVSQLEGLAPLYVATLTSEHEHWNAYPEAARRAVEVLNRIDIKPMRPLLLAIVARFDKREAADSLSFLVSLGVRLMIAATIRSAAVESPLADLARDIYAKEVHTAAEIRERLGHLTPSDARFREHFERASVANAWLGRYYLRSLEQAVKEDPTPWFIPAEDPTQINLEHVLPQKPETPWPGFEDADISQYARRLGNLVLLRTSDNSNLKSADFATKRPVYAAAPYELTLQVAGYDQWTPAEITARQRVLADYAIRAWPIQKSASRPKGKAPREDVNEVAASIVARATGTD
jgi:hypothetical protein